MKAIVCQINRDPFKIMCWIHHALNNMEMHMNAFSCYVQIKSNIMKKVIDSNFYLASCPE